MKIQLFIVGFILFFTSLSAQVPAGYKVVNVPLPRGFGFSAGALP